MRFWGHDSAMEVSFLLEYEALRLLSPGMPSDEDAILKAFDANWNRITATASRAYSAKRADIFVLSARDFAKTW